MDRHSGLGLVLGLCTRVQVRPAGEAAGTRMRDTKLETPSPVGSPDGERGACLALVVRFLCGPIGLQ